MSAAAYRNHKIIRGLNRINFRSAIFTPLGLYTVNAVAHRPETIKKHLAVKGTVFTDVVALLVTHIYSSGPVNLSSILVTLIMIRFIISQHFANMR